MSRGGEPEGKTALLFVCEEGEGFRKERPVNTVHFQRSENLRAESCAVRSEN